MPEIQNISIPKDTRNIELSTLNIHFSIVRCDTRCISLCLSRAGNAFLWRATCERLCKVFDRTALNSHECHTQRFQFDLTCSREKLKARGIFVHSEFFVLSDRPKLVLWQTFRAVAVISSILTSFENIRDMIVDKIQLCVRLVILIRQSRK